MKKILLFTTIILSLTSCKMIKEVQRLAECEYAFISVSDTELAGVKIQEKESMRDLGMSEMTLIGKAFLMRNMKLTFTANIAVKNTNAKTAALNRLEWIMSVEDTKVAEGVINDRFEVAGGETKILPVDVEFDVMDIWRSGSRDDILNMLFNLADIGGKPTTLKLKLRPSVMIAGKQIATPNYFTVKTDFGD